MSNVDPPGPVVLARPLNLNEKVRDGTPGYNPTDVTNVTDGVNGHNDNNNIGLNGVSGNIDKGGRNDYHGTNGINEHRTLTEMEMGSPRTEDEHRELIDSTAYARDDNLPPGSSPTFPNPLTHVRFWGKEYFAEFLGTMIFLIFAYAAGAQLVLGTNDLLVTSPKSDPAANALGWGAGIALGVWFAGGISGAHLNPAITLSQAVFRELPWRKVPGYMTAQLWGAIVATLIVYGNYQTAMHIVDPGKTSKTASIFVTYPVSFIGFANAWYSEFVGTAMLCGFVMAISDKNNNPPAPGLVPIALFLFFTGITITWGWLTAFAINPARDLGPRIALSFVGYGSSADIWTYKHWWWISGVITADFTGGLFGAFIYDLFVFFGGESPLNQPFGKWKGRGWKLSKGSRPKGPAGI